MKKLEVNQMENLEGGKPFWGSECTGYTPCQPSMFGAPGIMYPTFQYYIFGIAVGGEYTGSEGIAC